ncbi:MAG: hypothetical protein ABI222_07170 [Opitutaceae bacterium]
MFIPSFKRAASMLVLIFAAAAVAHAELPVIAKARAYLGSESALNAIKSVHYVGSVLVPNAADPKKPTRMTVDIIFQAPYRQRTVRSTATVTDTTALDDFDSWHRIQDAKDPTRWKMQLLTADQIRRQRAIAWENLAFYRGLEREGGQVLDQGTVAIDGITCRKVAFVHAKDIVFYRSFDVTNGRLVQTETESGSTIREQGEIRVNGVRFPRVITNSVKDAQGKNQTITVTFDRITVNETHPESFFEVPPLIAK